MSAVTVRATKIEPKARRPKGKQTRLTILDSVLNIIAREGTRGVTHRAVAAEADVQLSLTTYYFADIDTMIREAFAHFSQQARPDIEQLWNEIFTCVDQYSAAQLRKVAVREALCEQLTNLTTQYIVTQIVNKPVGLAVEQVFFTHTRLSNELRLMGMEHRAQLIEPIVTLCARFNSADPEVDAELLLNSITTLEYQALAIAREEVDRDRLRRLLARQIGWIMGLKRAGSS